MPDLSNWTYGHPSAVSDRRNLPSGHRSDKSHTRAAWEEGHYWDTGSAGSAGVHKEGSGVIPARADEGGISVGTAAYEVALGTDTGRLYATGSALSYPQPLSAGTSFDLVVVGPYSLATADTWVMSYKTGGVNTHLTWNDLGPYTERPFVFYNAIAPFQSVSSVYMAWLESFDSSGGTFQGRASNLNDNSETSLQDLPSVFTSYVGFVSIGQVARSVLS